jgi:hypothetical protein
VAHASRFQATELEYRYRYRYATPYVLVAFRNVNNLIEVSGGDLQFRRELLILDKHYGELAIRLLAQAWSTQL